MSPGIINCSLLDVFKGVKFEPYFERFNQDNFLRVNGFFAPESLRIINFFSFEYFVRVSGRHTLKTEF